MPKYISAEQLAERYSVSQATIWRWAQAKRLPRPVQLSPSCTRWIVGEIEARDADRAAARETAPRRRVTRKAATQAA